MINFKLGKVAIVGRPNTGKSTLLNNLVNHKVAIVSPKPQTTRSQIVACLEDQRGQIFFLDTPGFYEIKAGSAQYNSIIAHSIEEADVVIYLVDHTREWGQEEERIWNLISVSKKPIILVINKIDIGKPSFKESYLALLSKHIKNILEISALQRKNLKDLISLIFSLLPKGERDKTVDYFPTPLISQSAKEYLAEIIREKIYQHTGQEVPYKTAVRVDLVEENEEENKLKIKGRIIVENSRYKAMLIGKKGKKINQIKNAIRRELTVATGKEISVNLRVEK